jgi:hypothetical protein
MLFPRASVVELVDALDSKSGIRKDVSVRFRPEAPIKKLPFAGVFLLVFAVLEADRCSTIFQQENWTAKFEPPEGCEASRRSIIPTI